MSDIEQQVRDWLGAVVIGLNLCPFAGKPTRENRVRFHVTTTSDTDMLLQELADECARLEATAPKELETTLLIMPNALGDFYDYTQFLVWARSSLKRKGWQGVFQLASFHPQYCFAGAEPEDAENLTNRSPFPIVHIIREGSLAAAISYFDDVEGIPDRNKLCVEGLSVAQRASLFPYLYST